MDTTGKVRLAVANLRAGVSMLQSGDDWKRALDVQAKFHRYSFANCALIRVQFPEATQVAGFNAWKRLGRHVKKGEKGIMVLAPAGVGRREIERADGSVDERTWLRFRVAHVFDVSQTDGKELPAFVPPVQLDDVTFASSVDELRKVALALPDGVVSAIDLRPRRAGDPTRAGGWYCLDTRAIVVVTDNVTRAQQFRTLVHEVAHAILHPAGEHHDAPVREVEAESVAYVVCSALGLDASSYSFPYVSHWAQGESAAKLVQQSGERIAKTARRILEALHASRPTGDDGDEHRSNDDGDDAAPDTERTPLEVVAVPLREPAAMHLDAAPSEAPDDQASRDAAKVAKRDADARRASNAASRLASEATADGGARRLDTKTLLREAIASAANKWIAFTVGDATVTVSRARLARCAGVLRRRKDLSAFVDADGLHFRWNDGRGGLNLIGRDVPTDESAVLRVVFPVVIAVPGASQPVVAAPEPAVAPELRATTRWQRFMAMREIAELLGPAVEQATVPQRSTTANLELDVATLERVRALLAGAASRDQLGREASAAP